MIIRCAWCKEILGTKPPYKGKYADDITDGIYDNCLETNFPTHAGIIKDTLEVDNIERIYHEEVKANAKMS